MSCHGLLPALRGDGDWARFAPRASFWMSLLGSGCCGHTTAMLSSCLCRQAVVCSAEQEQTYVWACGVVGDPLSVSCCLGVGTWVTGALLSLVSQNRAFISGRVAVSLKAVRLVRVQARSRINGLHVPARYWPPVVLTCLCAAVICREMCVLGTGSAPCWDEGGRTMAHGLRGPFAGWTVASSRLVCEL